MWISNLDAGLGPVYLMGQTARQRAESMRGEISTVDAVQQHTTVPEKPRKRRTRLVFLVGTGVYRAIAAVGHQARSAQIENPPAAGPAMPQTTPSVVHPETSGAVTSRLPGQ